MRHRSSIPIAIAGAGLLLFSGLMPALAQKGPGGTGSPVVLRLLVWDQTGRQSEAAATDLVRLADEISGGAIQIEPTFGGGGDTASAVINGDTELAILASREWDAEGVTSLDVLEAPFLIDNDALALAVATSDIADDAMAGLNAKGVAGLAMWPEDLRHLFAFNPSGADFSTPAGLADADVSVPAGQPGMDLITTLGGRLYASEAVGDLTGDRDTDAAAGTLEGMVTGLWGAGLPTGVEVTVAGDLVVFSKYQMLVGNEKALEKLTEQQRADLDVIVGAVQEGALGRHFTEAELATERCQAGGRVISIGAQAIEAYKAAAQPLTDALAADPVTGPLMTAVAALSEATPVAPGAGVCEPQVTAYLVSDTAGTYGTLPPDGSYRAEISVDDLVARGASPDWAAANAGTMTWTFSGGRVESFRDDLGSCTGTAMSQGGTFVSLETDAQQPCDLDLRFVWRPTADGIAFVLTGPGASWTPDDFASVQAHLERDWVRVDAPMPSIAPAPAFIGDQEIPAGSYRVSLTPDDLEAAGASPDYAGRNGGTWTWTFSDGAWSAQQMDKQPCHGTVTVSGDHLELDQTPDGDCGMAYDLRWRPEGDGIRLEMIGINWATATPQVMADEGALVSRIWSRVDGAMPSIAPAAALTGDQLPPDGTYRTEITREDLLARGMTGQFAASNAATITWTLDGGTTLMRWSHAGQQDCLPTYSVEQDVVRFVFTGRDGCTPDTVDLRWKLDGDQLTFQVVAASTPQNLIEDRAWLERAWTKVQ